MNSLVPAPVTGLDPLALAQAKAAEIARGLGLVAAPVAPPVVPPVVPMMAGGNMDVHAALLQEQVNTAPSHFTSRGWLAHSFYLHTLLHPLTDPTATGADTGRASDTFFPPRYF